MSDNGQQAEVKVIFSAQMEGNSLRITIAPGIPLEKLSHAARVLNLQIDNIIIALNQQKPTKPIMVDVPQTIIDKMRKGIRLD